MTQEDDKADKVVNLAEARKRQRTVQEKPSRKGGSGGYDKAMMQQKKRSGGERGSGRPMGFGKRLAAVAQLIVFLAICYLMIQTCQGG
jgi:hypothetical protein